MSQLPLSGLSASVERRAVLTRRIRLLVGATISWNVVEAVVAIAAGSAASSTALIGFGLDSVIEVSSALAVAWQFAGDDPQARERVALKVIAGSFFALAAYVTVESIRSMAGGGAAEHSTVGVVIAALSLAVMPVLSFVQRRTGGELGSRSAVADSKQTLLCTYLAAVLLVGLLLNMALGWSWADPLAALVIAGLAVNEGRQALKGQDCCADGVGLLLAGGTTEGAACGGDDDCCATSDNAPQRDEAGRE
ncbi:cation transporter [Segeticoccus rhizosphaerae]|uniref:cation transporter n=1 Tax=Segeticoccus rhizosphaerae TaxID=1104777 RepID=UPI0010C04FF5|nr:cation transporter [Ornithinicoccus soli]